MIRTFVDEDALLSRVRSLGLAKDEDARAAIGATLAAIDSAPREETAFYEAVAIREGVRAGFGREHAQIVLRALGELLSPRARRRLERSLPGSMARLLDVKEPAPAEAAYRVAASERHHTLASGRPGSRHPLSEAAPPGAQAHSVVREKNPHGDTKLSSAHGMTQEREHESLAELEPNTTRNIAEAKD